ncbi:hypothetical protein MRB53_040470 [Persea americana]|nr:hypothetical protein MRB53_040470 [Persea americana]
MLQRFQQQTWTCTRCLLRQAKQRRGLVHEAQAAGLAESRAYIPSTYTTAAVDQDDDTLRRGFQKYSTDALQKCQAIVAKVANARTNDDYRHLVRDLDRLSDQLCRVIDLVEFIRNVHPDSRIQQAAAQAHGTMYEYMNVLNTTSVLNDQLQKASTIREVADAWSEEERMTAKILLKDFAQSAVSGTEDTRARFVDLSNQIVQLGSEILDNMAPERMSIKVASSKLKGLDPVAARQMTRFGGASIPTHGRLAVMALKSLEDADTRKELYLAHRTASKASVARIEALVRARAELAGIAGHESFAHMTLADKMAKTPEAVMQFLRALAKDNLPRVQRDNDALRALKASHTNDPSAVLHAWDRDFYGARRAAVDAFATQPPDVLSAYFSLGTVMQGLSRLFTRLYGIRLVPTPCLPGEAWNDDVRRLDVVDEVHGHVGVLYCDLFERPNKSPNPAHFTLRCSREITSEEVAAVAHDLPPSPSLEDVSHAINDGMALSHDEATGHALHSLLGRTKLQNVAGTRCATDFAELPSVLMERFATSPAVLGLYARHWQTGKALDVEDPRLLARLRRVGGADADYGDGAGVGGGSGGGSAGRRAAETEAQAQAQAQPEPEPEPEQEQVLEQDSEQAPCEEAPALSHSTHEPSTQTSTQTPSFSTTPEPAGAAWHGFFGHLFGYGGVYYSYLFDRAIAGRVWRDVFDERSERSERGERIGASRWSGASRSPRLGNSPGAGSSGPGMGTGPGLAKFKKGPLSREAGEHYKTHVLSRGGARDPWVCVAGVLGMEELAHGGEEAMRAVGEWGV